MAIATLQFSREARLSSDVIAWFSAGDLSHVDAVIDGGLLGAFERKVSGYGSGVFMRRPGYIQLAAQVQIDIPCSDMQRQAWEGFLRQQLGEPYDWDVIAGFATGANWQDPGKWICSQMQTAALQVSGILPELYLPANKITPTALALVCSALPGITLRKLK